MSKSWRTHDVYEPEGVPEFPVLFKYLQSSHQISRFGLEEKTQTAFDGFLELLKRQPIVGRIKEELEKLVVEALNCQAHIAQLRLAEIRMVIQSKLGVIRMSDEFGAQCARYGHGPAARRSHTLRLEMCRVLDGLFHNGTTDIGLLYDIMVKDHSHLLVKNKKGELIDSPQMKRLWLKHRRNP
jgi:hypothetical protein